MDRGTEIALLGELHGLREAERFFLDPAVARSPVARYADPARFEAERERILRADPRLVAHASEIPEPGCFATLDLEGLPVLVARGADGIARAFLNVCRHRGARVVREPCGRRGAFSCPYHAWTYGADGRLRGIPHEGPGFPGLDRAAHGLRALPCAERAGLIWIVADPGAEPDWDAHLGPLDADLRWLGTEGLAVAATDTFERRANWKLLAEGGLEAYHFKIAHAETIGPHFLDNLSTYEMLGPHLRSVLARGSLEGIDPARREAWALRDHANVLYTLFPCEQLLATKDHVGWMSFRPLAADRTEVRLTTLVPAAEAHRAEHWARSHAITRATLDEDFALNEEVQEGLGSGANEALTFGRYEGALEAFNRVVDARLG